MNVVVINGIKMELKAKLTPTEGAFLKTMAKRGFFLTYYPKDDTHNNEKEKGSIAALSVTLKGINKVQM